MKKLLSLCVVALLLVSGCGSDSSSSSDSFVVGMECNYPPFNWQTNKKTDSSVSLGGAGYCDGYDVMISQKIADSLGKELVIKKIAWDGLIPALEAGSIDAIIAGMTANEKREQGVDFTTPYFESEMVMIVRKGDAAASFTDIQQFSGKSVIGQKNTNYDDAIDQIKGVNHITPKAAYPELVLALQSGQADGITAELPVAKSVVASNPDLTIVHFAEGKGFDMDTSVSIGLKNNTRDSEFFKSVQSALDKISKETRDELMIQAVENQPKQD